jgi:hypothetical protein
MQSGIPESEIEPPENVFAFDAQKTLVPVSCRGERGAEGFRFIETEDKETYLDTDELNVGRLPWVRTCLNANADVGRQKQRV